MVLKGVMTIELTDENTGAVETVTEENMITEAVNNILGLNPMGIFYAATAGNTAMKKLYATLSARAANAPLASPAE